MRCFWSRDSRLLPNLAFPLLAFYLPLMGAIAGPAGALPVFADHFNASANDLDMENAYILCYLNTMIYPQYIGPTLDPPVHESSMSKSGIKAYKKLAGDNAYFQQVYTEKISPLFAQGKDDQPVDIAFVYDCNLSGYDPEAMVISFSKAVLTVFRGTDRSKCAPDLPWDLGWNWSEWVVSDFHANAVAVDNRKWFSGEVHAGFWNSLAYNGFIDKLASKVKARVSRGKGLPNKPVWIAGHSLGGAQAQIFALYLDRKYNIRPKGLYLYSSPSAGSQQFVSELEASMSGRKHIQRFVFKTDPITMLPPGPAYARAGVKNYFCDVKFLETDAIDLEPGTFPWDVCFHHPTWILQGLRNELPPSVRTQMPPKVELADDFCTNLQEDLGVKDEPCRVLSEGTQAVEEMIEDAVEAIAWTLQNIADNAMGKAVAEGKYRIISYMHSKKVRKYLTRKTCVCENQYGYVDCECDQRQCFLAKKRNDATQIWRIKRDGANYVICKADNTDSVVEIAADEIFENYADVDTGKKEWVDAVGNQHWWFFKVVSSGKTYYLIRSQSAPGKMIDAADSCNSDGNNCTVNVNEARPGDPSQAWILEKVD